MARTEALDYHNLRSLLDKTTISGKKSSITNLKAALELRHKVVFGCFEKVGEMTPENSRGADKIICTTDKLKAKYVSPGWFTKQGGKKDPCGVFERSVKSEAEPAWNIVEAFVKDKEQKIKKYLPSRVIRAIEVAKPIVGIDTHTLVKNGIFNAVAFGRNSFLTCHCDMDSFYSVIYILTQAVPQYNDGIVCYFCFPEYGLAVGLRPGDILIFNPRAYHCASCPVDPDMEYYSMSMFLKTKVVGENDNNKPLTEEQKKILHEGYFPKSYGNYKFRK